MIKIKILKDTPFHLQGMELEEKEFKDIYPKFKNANFKEAGNKIFETELKDRFDYYNWFKVITPLSFGNKEVKLEFFEKKLFIVVESLHFKYLEVLDWYNHFCHFMVGFSNTPFKSHNTDIVRFEGFSLKRYMLPEKCFLGINNRNTCKPLLSEIGHLSNTAESNQTMHDKLNFFISEHTNLNEIELKIGCTTGSVMELITILNECKKINENSSL